MTQPDNRSALDTATAAAAVAIITLSAVLAIAAAIGVCVLVQRSQKFEPGSEELVAMQLYALEIALEGLAGAGLLLAAGIGLLILRSNRRRPRNLGANPDSRGLDVDRNLR